MAKKVALGNINGRSAYQVAVDQGFSGTQAEWLESLKGDVTPEAEAARDDAVTAAGAAGAAASEAASHAADVLQVVATNDGIMAGIAADEDSAFATQQRLTIDEAIAGVSGGVLGGGVCIIGPTLPEGIPAGREYIWHKTDGQGNLLDIIVGIVPHPGVSTWEALAAQYATWEDIPTSTYPTWESLTGTN